MVVRHLHLRIALIFISGVFALSCSGNSPEGVVVRFYKSLNSGGYSKAKEMYTAEALQFVDAQFPGDRFIAWADMETRKGTIQDVKVNTADTRGEGSDLTLTIVYKDGPSVNRTVSLKVENGYWKLGLIR